MAPSPRIILQNAYTADTPSRLDRGNKNAAKAIAPPPRRNTRRAASNDGRARPHDPASVLRIGGPSYPAALN
jgi:hypothetical protein